VPPQSGAAVIPYRPSARRRHVHGSGFASIATIDGVISSVGSPE
jgi:hypothetical protein